MSWKFACHRDEIADGAMKEVVLDGVSLLIICNAGEVFAIPPLCPHMAEPLSNGVCDGTTLICLKHLWQWDLVSGSAQGDAEVALKKYATRVDDDGSVHVLVEKELTYDYATSNE